MNNPTDTDSPHGPVDDASLDPLTVEAAAGRDHRTQEQRNHDAFAAILTWILSAGDLGEHNGLPMHLIVTMTLQQLETETGLATTATGGVIPVKDALEVASRRHPYLCLLDLAGRPLHFARSRRGGNMDQRLALFAVERGCTGPQCPTPAAGCQIHHRDRDFQFGGLTNIDELTLACPGHHSCVDANDGIHMPDGWHTRRGAPDGPNAGRTEWIPPASVDPDRRPVVNDRHLADRLLAAASARVSDRREAEWERWLAWQDGPRHHTGNPDNDPDPGDP